MSNTCGNCKHGDFLRTPTGRIRKGVAGHCNIAATLQYEFNQTRKHVPPCIASPNPAHVVCVWADYDATHCNKWELAK